jgi:hypothetical protein
MIDSGTRRFGAMASAWMQHEGEWMQAQGRDSSEF